jgi:hypothetical protein
MLNGMITVLRSRRESTWRAGVQLEIAGGGKGLMEGKFEWLVL